MKFYSTLVLLSVLCVFQQVQAFCVYNKSNYKKIEAFQDSWHTLSNDRTVYKSGILYPGYGKSCCNYTNRDCNYLGRIDEAIMITIFIDGHSAYTLPIQAGGYIEIHDKEGTLTLEIKTFLPDGNEAPCYIINPALKKRDLPYEERRSF